MPTTKKSPQTSNSDATLKYRIKEFLGRFSAVEQATVRKKIRANCGHSASNKKTLSEWENIPSESHQGIPFDAMQVMAAIFNCRMEDLTNHRPTIQSPETVYARK